MNIGPEVRNFSIFLSLFIFVLDSLGKKERFRRNFNKLNFSKKEYVNIFKNFLENFYSWTLEELMLALIGAKRRARNKV